MITINKKITGIILMILLSAPVIFGQTGSIEGIITDKSNSEALPGTTIVIAGTTAGTFSDVEGKFILNDLKPGLYTINISYVSYLPATIENIK